MPSKRFSPLRYPGGKGKMYSIVKKIILENNLEGCTYCEPFAGGAEVALRLLNEKIASKIIINDYDVAIYAFWYSIVNCAEEFIELIYNTEISLSEREKQKKIYIEKNEKSLLTLGFATFYLNRVNRSGIIKGGPISTKKDSKYPLGCRFNKVELINRIRKISELREYIEVTNEEANDLLECINDNASELENKYFLFIDPPYYVKGKNLYMNFFTHDMHVNLYNTINQMSGINYIITYDDTKPILDIYWNYVPIHYDLTYTVETKVKGKEVMFHSNDITINF